MIAVIAPPEQMVWLVGVATTFTEGLTVTVAVTGVPEQVLITGVAVKVTVTGALVLLTSEPLISPEPLAAIPVTEPALSLVQL